MLDSFFGRRAVVPRDSSARPRPLRRDVPSWTTWASCPSSVSSRARLWAQVMLSSTTSTLRPVGRAGLAPRRHVLRGLGLGRRGGGRWSLFRHPAGSRTTNSLPRPRPSLVASTVPPCISTRLRTSVRPRPRPALRPVERVVDLGEQVEDAGEHLGGDADPVVADAEGDVLPLDAPRPGGSARLPRCTWPRCSAGSRAPGPSASASASTVSRPGGMAIESRWRWASMTGRLVSTA